MRRKPNEKVHQFLICNGIEPAHNLSCTLISNVFLPILKFSKDVLFRELREKVGRPKFANAVVDLNA